MKKYLFLLPLLFLGIFLLPKISLADNGTTTLTNGYFTFTVNSPTQVQITTSQIPTYGSDYDSTSSITNPYSGGLNTGSFGTYTYYLNTNAASPIGYFDPTICTTHGDDVCTVYQSDTGLQTFIYNNGLGCVLINSVDLFSGNCWTMPHPPAISFNYPINGSTSALFSSWVVSTTNITSDNFILGVLWSATDTIQNGMLNTQTADVAISSAPSLENFIASTLYNTAMPTSTWYAQAYITYLYSSSTAPGTNSQILVASSSIISFSINNSLPIFQVPGAYHPNQGFLIPNTATSTGICVPPNSSGWFDIGAWGPGISYGLCSVAQVYFGNQQPGYQFMQDQWTAFQNTAPFNLVFGVVSSTQSALTNNSTTQQDLAISFYVGNKASTVSVLSSSTLTQLFVTAGNGSDIPSCDRTCAQGKVDTLMGYLSNMIYAGTAVTTAAMIL